MDGAESGFSTLPTRKLQRQRVVTPRRRVESVGIRSWFVRALNRGTPPRLDPHEFVELASIPLFDATLLVERLREHGIEATCVESYNFASRSLSNGRIDVRRSQLADAQRLWVGHC